MKKTNATFTDILWRWNIGGKAIKKNHLSKKLFLGIVILLISNNLANAQLTITGQVRTRSEWRAGQGTLLQKGDVPAFFNSQRTRVNFGYTGYRFKFFTAIQDVRVWGQDASTNNQITQGATNGLMLHEAYAEIVFNDTMPLNKVDNISLKIGRQEIAYDDQKILGSLDWLQQARRHDAAVLKFAHKAWMADIGVAYNQNNLNGTGTSGQVNNKYNGVPATLGAASSSTISATSAYAAGTNAIGTMYKSFQYIYVGKKFHFGNASLLCFKDDFNKTKLSNGSTVTDRGEWSRITSGAYINATILRFVNITGSAYYQSGKDKTGRNLDAYLASATITAQLGRKLFIGPGFDYLSGDNGTSTSTSTSTTHKFDPLYGTPHKFWGYMDYFYVANAFQKKDAGGTVVSPGLYNYFFKIKYKPKDNLTLTLDIHQFDAGNRVSDGKGGTLKKDLGAEVDFVANYALTRAVSFELGYSIMSGSSTLAALKGVTNAELTPQWAYLMINVRPNFLEKITQSK
jgi:hypothetical protein